MKTWLAAIAVLITLACASLSGAALGTAPKAKASLLTHGDWQVVADGGLLFNACVAKQTVAHPCVPCEASWADAPAKCEAAWKKANGK